MTSVWQTGRITPKEVLAVSKFVQILERVNHPFSNFSVYILAKIDAMIYTWLWHKPWVILTEGKKGEGHVTVVNSYLYNYFPRTANNLDDGKPLVLLNISMSKDQYVALSSYPPPPRHSQDSDDSLRALEISEGPATNPQRIGRCILPPFFSSGIVVLIFLLKWQVVFNCGIRISTWFGTFAGIQLLPKLSALSNIATPQCKRYWSREFEWRETREEHRTYQRYDIELPTV